MPAPWKKPRPDPDPGPTPPLSFTCAVCGRTYKSLKAALNCNHKD